jgi:histidyl-tRNA synthetase
MGRMPAYMQTGTIGRGSPCISRCRLPPCLSPCSRTPPSLFHQVDDVVMVMEEALRPAACGVAARLRNAGRSVDLVLEPKKLKWAFKAAERAGAARLLLVGGEEWERGAVAVRDLAARSQEEVPLDQL